VSTVLHRLLRAAVIALLVATAPGRAQVVEIVSDATARFAWPLDDSPAAMRSNSVRAMMGMPLNFALMEQRQLSLPVGAAAELSHRLVNTGTTPLRFRLHAFNQTGDAFDLAELRLMHDANGNDHVDGDEVEVNPDQTVTLAPGEHIDLLVWGRVPMSASASVSARVAIVADDMDSGAVLVRVNTVIAQAQSAGAGLLVEKTASRRDAEVGETVDYTVRIRNVAGSTLAGVALRDELPRGFSFVSGSLQRDRIALANPADAARGIFTVALGDLTANATTTIRYRARLGPLALGGDGINRAQATATGYASNVASVRVQARAGVFTTKGVVIGKVFLDSSADGAQQAGETGVPGVRIYLEDGTYAVTDADGKFSFYGLAPRTHVLKLDPLTLPPGAEPEISSTRQAGDPASRFVDLKRYELHQANFAVWGTSSQVTEEIAARRARLRRAASETDRQIKVRLTPDGEPLPVADPKALPANGVMDGLAADVLKLKESAPENSPVSAAVVDQDANLTSLDATPGFVDLREGETLPDSQTDIRVKGPVGAKFTLAVNGQLIGPDQVGRVVRIDAHGVEVWTFVGVNLVAGENRLRLLLADPFGNPREGAARRVIAPGALARIAITPPERAVADGLTAVNVAVELRDARGTRVTTRTALTLTATTGRWLVDDLDPKLAGVQVFVEGGRASFALMPPLEPGDSDVTIASGAVHGETSFPFTPNLRPLLAAGVVEGVLNFGSRGGALLPAGARDGFEEELRAWSVSGDDGRLNAGGRAAFFLKGKIPGEMLLTAAYDSDKAKQERLFRDIQPGEYYPVYGDASVRGYDAQSTGRLYVRIDRNRSFLLVGDFTTQPAAATDSTTARGLSAYQRSLSGVKEHFESERVRIDAWASQDSTRQVVEEVAANGTSGPYQLGSRNARVNSERVEILTRDRNQSGRVLSARPMVRFFDYEFEPFTGRLLFKAPVPSLNADLDPISIRITYEVDDGGPAFWTYGTDAQVKLTDRLTLGGTFARDENPTGAYQLAGAGATLRIGTRSTLAVEAAESDSAEAGIGHAGRVDFRHKDERTDAHLFYGQTEAAFRNPAALLLPGRSEGGFKATRKLTPTTSLIAQGVLTEDASRRTRREGVRLDVAQSLGAWRFELGGRHSEKTAENASGLVRSTTVNSARAKITAPVPFLAGATAFGEYERDVQDRGKELAAVGFDATLPRGGRVYARHEFVTSIGGPFELNETDSTHTTVVGVESATMRDGQMFSEYRAGEELYGREAEAALGLRNRFTLADGIRANTSFERVTPVSGAGRNESTAVTGAIDFERERWRADARLEVRTSTSTDSILNSLGYARRLTGDWTFLGKTIVLRTETKGSTGGVAWQGRAQTGLAWRPSSDDRWNLLGKYELRCESDNRATALAARRLAHVLSSDVVFQPSATWKISSHYAAKWVDESGAGAASAHLVGGRVTHEFGRRWDAGLNAWALVSGNGRQRSGAFGPELGVTLRRNLRLGVGYNVAGFRDRDLANDRTTAHGVFVRLAFKFDEKLLNGWAKK
jgi:uncharacterized repeat protein (TIGR01451 family)